MKPSVNADFETWLFDWDGTILDTLELWARSWEQTFSEFGITIDRREVVTKAFGDWQYAQKKGVVDTVGFVERIYQLVNVGMHSCPLEEGIENLLENLKSKQKKIAVVTSSRRDLIQSILNERNLRKYVDVVLGFEDTINQKPNPEIVDKAVFRLGGDKNTSVLIGDTGNDILAAKAGGVKAWMYYPSVNQQFYSLSSVEALQPDLILESYKDLAIL